MGLPKQSGPLALLLCLCCTSGFANEELVREVKKSRTVRYVIDLLKSSGFEPVVLCGDNHKRVVVVTPELVGRVLCVGYDGIDGVTESYLSEDQIEKGFSSDWSNFGGEQRIWIAPEFGAFGLFLTKGAQTMGNYRIPVPLNVSRFKVVERSPDHRSVTSSTTMTLVNRIGTEFRIKVTQRVDCLEDCPYLSPLGDKEVFVGFETRTTIENIGHEPWTKETGPLSIWTIGQFPSKAGIVALMPFRPGPVAKLGEPVTTEYFKLFLPDGKPTLQEQWEVKEGVTLMRADGATLRKLEVPATRALDRLASIDLDALSMTIVDYDLHTEREYVKSYPQPYEGGAYGGGAMSTMLIDTQSLDPPFYELESCSPALFLKPGEQYCHTSHTYHFRAQKATLARICERYLNTDLETIVEFNKK